MKKIMKCSGCGKTFELTTGKNYCPECGSILWSKRFMETGVSYIK